MSTDYRLDGDFQLMPGIGGDVSLTSGDACFLQMLRLEAMASEGDLWYDVDWGWSLLDFKDARQSELTGLEIVQRIRMKLEAHEEISVDSIQTALDWQEDRVAARISFHLLSSGQLIRMNANIGRTEIEVNYID